jgi:hypothetical protein
VKAQIHKSIRRNLSDFTDDFRACGHDNDAITLVVVFDRRNDWRLQRAGDDRIDSRNQSRARRKQTFRASLRDDGACGRRNWRCDESGPSLSHEDDRRSRRHGGDPRSILRLTQ